jgi:hypothetical protein
MERLFFEFTIRAALLVAGTATVLFVLRVQNAAAKHKIWAGVTLLMLMLPGWAAWGPKASVRLLPVPAQRTTAETLGHDFSAGILPRTINSEASSQVTQSSVWTWRSALLGMYLLGVFSLLLRLAIGTIRARRLVFRAVLYKSRLTSSSLCGASDRRLAPSTSDFAGKVA